MQTIKEYAKNNGVTYEAIRKQIKTYEVELKEHIMKNGRTQYLDDYAVDFLNKKRANNTIIVAQADKDEEIKRLENENKALLLKVAELQEQLLKEKDEVKLLQEQKIQLLEQKESKPEKKKKWWWQK